MYAGDVDVCRSPDADPPTRNGVRPKRISVNYKSGPQSPRSRLLLTTGDSPIATRVFPDWGYGGRKNAIRQIGFSLSKKLFQHPGGNADIYSTWRCRVRKRFSRSLSTAKYIYACNGADLLQKSSTGAFADVASTPKLTRILHGASDCSESTTSPRSRRAERLTRQATIATGSAVSAIQSSSTQRLIQPPTQTTSKTMAGRWWFCAVP